MRLSKTESRASRITSKLVSAFVVILTLSCAMASSAQTIPAPQGHRQFFTINGAPLSSGCVFTYSAGTTTPSATYTTSTGLALNTNPIILNAGGFADIWLGASSYKFVVFSFGGTNCASGAQQWSEDNIPGAGVSVVSTAFSALTAASNSSAGTFAGSGNTWDFTAASAFKVPMSAAYSPTVNASIGYDTTANKWVFGANGATRNFGLASAAACAANQFVSTPATAIATAGCSTPTTFGQVTINTGLTFNATGWHHESFGASCTTAASVNATCTTVYTWNVAFADANYVFACLPGPGASGIPSLVNYTAKTASQITLQFVTVDGSAAQFANVDCMAAHN